MKPYKAQIKPKAQREILAAFSYYSLISPSVAANFLKGIEKAKEQLCMFPESGSPRYVMDKRVRHARFVHVSDYPYLILYVFEGDIVHIVRCVHARADILAGLIPLDEMFFGTTPGA